TSGDGAALQDIIQIIERRFPPMPLRVCPCAVQGAGAAEEIARAIRILNAEARADVLIVGRGGGSMEDLWAFNEPAVAQAIYESEIPVISAVGHETDVTIADFVADLRAPTPSAAAELAVPDYESCLEALHEGRERLLAGLKRDLAARRARLAALAGARGFLLLENRLLLDRQRTDSAGEALGRAALGRVRELRGRVSELRGRLEAVDPRAVLKRGYALLSDERGGAVLNARALKTGEGIRLRMHDGGAAALITRVYGKDE
ncbi:MAG: exodeoxyribonuclease VII large subunit, partial [Clostridia bacterium]|nr:exodeoxyribonuclease VII large subunit [Clostridia bacterium]